MARERIEELARELMDQLGRTPWEHVPLEVVVELESSIARTRRETCNYILNKYHLARVPAGELLMVPYVDHLPPTKEELQATDLPESDHNSVIIAFNRKAIQLGWFASSLSEEHLFAVVLYALEGHKFGPRKVIRLIKAMKQLLQNREGSEAVQPV